MRRVAEQFIGKDYEHSLVSHLTHLFSEEVGESMGRRMVTSREGGILLLEGPRLRVEEYRDSFGGIAVQEGSCAMPESAKVLRKVWAALP